MDPTTMTVQQTVLFGAAVGFIMGLLPLITGLVKRKIKLGLIGLLGAVVGGSIASLILALPVSFVFTWLILRKATSDTAAA